MARTDLWERLVPMLLPVFGGVLMALAFPDYNLWVLAWVAVVPLLVGLGRTTHFRSAFINAWIFGLTGFILSLSWVRISMHEYGGLPIWMCLIFLFILAAYCAIFPALAVALSVVVCRRRRLPLAAVLPFLWVAMEFFRGKCIGGFPWNGLGLSQYEWLAILQNADWGSYYSVSFLVVMVNCAITALILKSDYWKQQTVFAGLILAAAIGYGHVRLAQPETGRPFTAGIIQGNIDQHLKWDEKSRDKILDDHLALSESIVSKQPDLLVWSESALTFYFRFADRYAPYGDENAGWRIRDLVRKAGVPLITGTLDRIEDDVYNSAVMIRPEGLETYYYKEHLVPFGEYVPGGKLLFFVNRLVENAIGKFATGTSSAPLVYDRGAIGTTICYEQIFPELVRRRVKSGAEVICNITNDSWFGRSSAAMQHFSASCFRAVENRRPVIRAANTGISGAVDSRGRILHMSPLFRLSAFTVTVHTAPIKTAYLIVGDLFAHVCIFLSTILCIIYFSDVWKRRKSGRKS